MAPVAAATTGQGSPKSLSEGGAITTALSRKNAAAVAAGKTTPFLTRTSLEACLPKHSWFEPRPNVDRIVGLTIHCFALSMVVLTRIGARFLKKLAQLVLFMALHSSVERGQLKVTPLSKDQIRSSTICRLGNIHVILARIDHYLHDKSDHQSDTSRSRDHRHNHQHHRLQQHHTHHHHRRSLQLHHEKDDDDHDHHSSPDPISLPLPPPPPPSRSTRDVISESESPSQASFTSSRGLRQRRSLTLTPVSMLDVSEEAGDSYDAFSTDGDRSCWDRIQWAVDTSPNDTTSYWSDTNSSFSPNPQDRHRTKDLSVYTSSTAATSSATKKIHHLQPPPPPPSTPLPPPPPITVRKDSIILHRRGVTR